MFVADIFDFDFDERVLAVEVEIPSRLAAEPGIYAALWTNPPSGEGEKAVFLNRELIPVEPPVTVPETVGEKIRREILIQLGKPKHPNFRSSRP